MKTPCRFLFLTPLVLSSCDKAEDKSSSSSATDAGDSKPIAREAADKTTSARELSHAAPSATQDGQPAGNAVSQDLSSDPSNGIQGVPQEIADEILKEAANASSSEDRTRFITEQSNAWRHVNEFREKDTNLPDHRKRELLEALGKKHGISWNDMSTELDAQLKAHDEVMEYRLKGIPGLT